MSYLFVQTLVIQFFVGIVFLLLGLWGGKFLWGHDRHPHSPATGRAGTEPSGKKATPTVEDELKRLRMLNGKLEKENHKLRQKSVAEEIPTEEDKGSREVEETMEIVDAPVESEQAEASPAKPEKAAKPAAKKGGKK